MRHETHDTWTSVLDRLEADLAARDAAVHDGTDVTNPFPGDAFPEHLGTPTAGERARAHELAARIEDQVTTFEAQRDIVRHELDRVAGHQTSPISRSVTAAAPSYLDRRA